LPAISLVRMIPPLGVNEGRRFYCVRAGRTKRPMKTARTKPAQGVSERRNLPQPAVQKAHFPSLLSRPEAIGPHLVPASRTAAMITKSGQLVAVIGRTAASEELGVGVARTSQLVAAAAAAVGCVFGAVSQMPDACTPPVDELQLAHETARAEVERAPLDPSNSKNSSVPAHRPGPI